MHSTIASEISKSNTDDILSYIPHDLRQYLVDTENPLEIRRHVDREHDRKVRLLLRRFTNQIQYGCTNPYCDVPTCLSYRKRTSLGPLRPHNDLTARALAVKCLEQYATHGRDLARFPNRGKGKRKQVVPSSDGLCWNDPVVPWYSDPHEHFARRNDAVRRRSFEEKKGLASPSTAVVQTPTRQPTTVTKSSGGEISLAPLNNHSVAEQVPVGTLKDDHSPFETQQGDATTSLSRSASISKPANCSLANGHISRPSAAKVDRRRQTYDQASLPQSLFKHAKLNFWDNPPSTPCTNVRDKRDEQHEDVSSENVEMPSNARSPAPVAGFLLTARPVSTFRILPPKAVEWFRETFVKHRESNEPAPKELRTFLDQCLYFVIGDPTRLLQSASTWRHSERLMENSHAQERIHESTLSLPRYETVVQLCDMIAQCFDDSDRCFHLATPISRALRNCYALPHYIKQSNTLIASTQTYHKFLSNSEIAHTILVVLSMLPSAGLTLAMVEQSQSSDQLDNSSRGMRYELQHRTIGSHAVNKSFEPAENATLSSRWSSAFPRYPPANCQLCETVADLVSHRIAIDSAAKALRSKHVELEHGQGIISEIISLIQRNSDGSGDSSPNEYHAVHMLSCMQMVIFLKWDRTPIIRRTGPVSGALEMLKALFVCRKHLSLDETLFCMQCLPPALDEVEMPFEWLSFKPDATKLHILQFSFLFPPKVIVRYFRSLNLKIMKQSHEKAMAVYTNGRTQLLHRAWTVANIDEVLNLTRPHMARYFVMTIRRSDILEDAIGQIWQRERRELLRPLKVTLGKEEGENGLDHGGVQQEFFRLAFAQAFDPSYGMFDIDATTHMTWFRPASLEQMYKYEALGILMSLAIYNGVTVPITMPLAFYRKVLGMKVRKIDHIADGWPELAQSFSQLLDWNDGDVEDVMALTYDFSYDVFGKTVTIDMAKKHTSVHTSMRQRQSYKGKGKASPIIENDHKPVRPPQRTARVDIDALSLDGDSDTNDSHEDSKPLTPTPVTNANREAFVRSYIDHLTNITIQPQLDSFLKGLYTLLSPTALSLFTPSHLKLLFEGHPTSHAISVPAWRSATKYEDFTIDEPIIIWFWDILENDFTQTQMRQLLEFVTASNRLPVGGWEGVTFIVQRNGGGDDRLPGSSTCYGRLLLPEYSCKEVLRERLIKAVEEGLGFGMI